MKKLEPSDIAGGNVKWKTMWQFLSPLENNVAIPHNAKHSYQMTQHFLF